MNTTCQCVYVLYVDVLPIGQDARSNLCVAISKLWLEYSKTTRPEYDFWSGTLGVNLNVVESAIHSPSSSVSVSNKQVEYQYVERLQATFLTT